MDIKKNEKIEIVFRQQCLSIGCKQSTNNLCNSMAKNVSCLASVTKQLKFSKLIS